MMRSYFTDRTLVPCAPGRRRAVALATRALLGAALATAPVAAQAPSASTPPIVIPPGGPSVRLQIRIFDGADDVTRDTRGRLYPAGERGTPIKMTLSGDQAFEAEVPVGLYDVQAIRERAGEVSGVRWVEHLLVQRYPDEFGRHLQVVNLKNGFGALQIRPDGDASSPAGWSAVATPPGSPDTEVGKARALGPDLLLVVPSGTYDIKVVLPSAPPAWINGLDIPDARTRLKTWPIKP
jgi:hypothetical protein